MLSVLAVATLALLVPNASAWAPVRQLATVPLFVQPSPSPVVNSPAAAPAIALVGNTLVVIDAAPSPTPAAANGLQQVEVVVPVTVSSPGSGSNVVLLRPVVGGVTAAGVNVASSTAVVVAAPSPTVAQVAAPQTSAAAASQPLDVSKLLGNISPCLFGCLQKVPNLLSAFVSGQVSNIICDTTAVNTIQTCSNSCGDSIAPTILSFCSALPNNTVSNPSSSLATTRKNGANGAERRGAAAVGWVVGAGVAVAAAAVSMW
ncbi:hypothetical protein HDU96_008589 [Phlyctochytrium bullatum]|nr:hypothetical protein HDU96_008589 [Phlyctochytrium bullatum]